MNKTTAFIFFGIILVGLVGSLFYFTNREKFDSAIKPFVSVTEVGEDPEQESGEKEKPKESTDSSAAAKPGPDVKPEATEPGIKKNDKEFASAEEAMKMLAEKAGTKDFNEFLSFVGEGAIAENIRPEVKKAVESPELFLSKEKPFSEVSKSANSVRWALNYEPKGEGAVRELYADLALGADGSKTLSISKISLPLDLTTVAVPEAAEKPGNTPNEAAPAKPAVLEGVDALTVAHAFSKAVIQRDFKVARALSDPATVTDERVAALMIAIEEGDFALKQERPLVVTLSRDDITWVLTRVESEGSTSEFALELGQAENTWAVNGLTFSKVLSTLAARAGGGGVAYSPIVEDPMGGDSLVLYFEFDQASLTPRGNRQLAVIADILSQGTDRSIRINGHADAKGTDEYNAQLSDRRAASIRQGLISMGVKPDQVITEAFGETKPRRPNFNPDGTDNRSGQSQNRRAEVYLDF